MGAGLVKAAYAAADREELREHAPMRLYAYMAVTALDSDRMPMFYGGREALAHALAAPAAPGGFKLVRQALRTLTDRGFIATFERAAPGHYARYQLLNGRGEPLNGAPSDSSEGGSTAHPQSAVKKPKRRTLRVSTAHPQGFDRAPSDSPRGGKDEHEEDAPPSTTRTCTRHSSWLHDDPCRACARDRQAAEAAAASRRPATMSPRTIDCGPGRHVRLPDGTCTRCENRDPLREGAA